MHKKLAIIALFLFLVSCSEYEDILFLELKDVKVNGIKNGKLLIGANAVFRNPNTFKGKLKSANIYVLFKGDTLAHITHIDKITVTPTSDFSVPLAMEVSMSKLQSGLLSNLASLIRKKSVELEFIGNVKVSSFGFSQTIPINYKEEIEF